MIFPRLRSGSRKITCSSWPFIENVELPLISSAFGLACFRLRFQLRRTGRRGAFTLSLPNVPTRRADVYPEPSLEIGKLFSY